MNLYEVTSDYLQLQQMIEDGEDIPEDLLNNVSDAVEAKADGYARVIRNMEAQISVFKAEENLMADKRKRIEKGVEKLKQNLQNAMIATGKRKFKTNLFSFSIQKNGGADPVIVDVPTSDLPDDLVIIKEEPDKKALAAYMKETGDFTYAHFGDRGESLRIK